jgi:hypothetical protein
VAKIYEYFGFELGEASRRGMQKYLDENPRESKPRHQYPVFDGNLELERRAYARYQAYFNVPNEI